MHSYIRNCIILALVWMVSAQCVCGKDEVATVANLAATPRVKVLRVKSPVVIDGIIEAEWAKAPVLTLAANSGPGAGSEVSLHSEARVMNDQTNLYVLFVFEDPSITYAYVNSDDILWDSGDRLDLIEVLLQPESGCLVYYEFAVNPAGALLDAQVKWKRNQPTWNLSWPRMHSSVAAGKINKDVNGVDGWCIEMAIPFDSIGFKPGKGKILKANFHRADVDLPAKWLSWSPTLMRSIHVPSKFGKLIF